MTLPKNVAGGNVVCEQREWEAIEAIRPGFHTLLHTGVGSEQEAEKLARGVPAEIVAPVAKTSIPVAPLFATAIPTTGRSVVA